MKYEKEIIGIGLLFGFLYFIIKKSEAKPTETIEIMSCVVPQTIKENENINISVILHALRTNISSISKNLIIHLDSYISSKIVTLKPDETKEVLIDFSQHKIPPGEYNLHTEII